MKTQKAKPEYYPRQGDLPSTSSQKTKRKFKSSNASVAFRAKTKKKSKSKSKYYARGGKDSQQYDFSRKSKPQT